MLLGDGVSAARFPVRRDARTAPPSPRAAVGDAVALGPGVPEAEGDGEGEPLGDGDEEGWGFCSVEMHDGRDAPDVAVALPMKKSPIEIACVTSCWCPVRMSWAAWHCHSTLVGVPDFASRGPVAT